jgi:hypothetical protein
MGIPRWFGRREPMDMPGDMDIPEEREALGGTEGFDAVGGEPSPRLVPHARKDLV